MKTRELRELNEERLKVQVASFMTEYEAWREATRSGKEKNHARQARLRKDIARAQTVLREKGGTL